MRNLALLVIFIALGGCAKPQILEKQYAPEQILHISEFRKLKELDAINRHVFYLNPGETIPLKLEIDSDVISLVQDQVDLKAEQKLFFLIRLSESVSKDDLDNILKLNEARFISMTPAQRRALFKDVMIFMGLDGTTWAPLNDKHAIKEVFGIAGGEFSLGLSMSETEGMWALFYLKLDKGMN